MTDERGALQRIDWSETFPFTRLFSTFKRAISFWAIMLGLISVLLTYFTGRIMDRMWIESDAGVAVAHQAVVGAKSGAARAGRLILANNEIEAYAVLDAAGFAQWGETQRMSVENAQREFDNPANKIGDTEIPDALQLLAARLETGLSSIAADADLDQKAKEAARTELLLAADVVRFELAGKDSSVLGCSLPPNRAASVVLQADTSVKSQPAAEELARIGSLMGKCRVRADYKGLKQTGPFITLLDYEMKCFAASVQGVCRGRFGFSGSATSDEPSMLGGVASAGSGIFWLVTQRPCFFVSFGLILLVIYSLCGGAICRIAAVRIAREESVSFKTALGFSRDKFPGLVMAVLMPVIAFVLVGVSIWVGGLVGAIPGLQVVTGLVYWLSLIGGFVLALIVILSITGFHLMWPTIAVEGSDAFDAIQRAYGYVMQRPWNLTFYSFILLIYGGLSFVFVRLLAMMTLKLSHMFTGAGMNLASGANAHTIGKLDAMWRMPAWQDLPLLPATGDLNFWGEMFNAPLSGVEGFTFFFFALFVFLVVGLVGGFVVSFYFCGATEMYFLLRRDVDAIDYDEIYYEELDDEFEDENDDVDSSEVSTKADEEKPADANADKPDDDASDDNP